MGGHRDQCELGITQSSAQVSVSNLEQSQFTQLGLVWPVVSISIVCLCIGAARCSGATVRAGLASSFGGKISIDMMKGSVSSNSTMYRLGLTRRNRILHGSAP